MNNKLITRRMIGVPLCEKHQDDILMLHSDPKVAKMLSANGKTISKEQSIESITRSVSHWSNYNYGIWSFYTIDSGCFIGTGGLKNYNLDDMDNEKVVGLAYAVRSLHWQKGYATEMAEETLNFASNELGINSIASWTLPQNIASQRVMEKVGFKYQRDFMFSGLRHRFYKLELMGNRKNV